MKRQSWSMIILALLGLGSINEEGSTAIAQTFGSRWGFGFGLGANQLYSDLAITGNGLGVDGHIERRLGSRTSLRLDGGYGDLPFTTSANVPLGITSLQRDAFKTNMIRGDLRFNFDLT
ncbi:MAG: hypothetical protein ONA90_09760, partial [candidate division KSB1 bacterium]|nr:hypothetical protein [candidate division KSB1 bacterium]